MRRFIQRTLTRAVETVGTVSRILTGQPPGLGPMPLTIWLRRTQAATIAGRHAIANRGPEKPPSATPS
jgi:hypothetical protein